MNYIKGTLSILWRMYFLLLFVLLLIIFYPFMLLFLPQKRLQKLGFWLQNLWAKMLLSLSGIFVKVNYEQPLDKNKTYIFCANHTTYLDIPMFYYFFHKEFRFIAKKELARIPLFGIMFKYTHILIDRQNTEKALQSIKIAEEKLKDNISIVMFPEGTMSKQPPKLGHFKTGAFKMSVNTQVEIVPVTFQNNYKLLPSPKKIFTPKGGFGIAYVFVHKPVSPVSFNNDAELLKEHVFSLINSRLTSSN